MFTRAVLLSALLLPATGFAATMDAKSSIDKVTIFRDRAEIERLAQIEFGGGNNTLIFGAIPQTINSDSLKISGLGSSDLQLISVQHKTRFFEEDRSEQVQALQTQLESLEDKSKSLTRKKSRLERELELLKQVRLDQETPSSEHVLTPRNPKEIHEILTLVSANGEKLDTEIDAIENELKSIAKKTNILRLQQSQFGSAKKSESIVEVKLNAKTPGKAALRLAYQVQGASWLPDYNLQRNVSKSAQDFSLETFGNIAQSTGEDWDNVEVVLSTARPQIGIARPSLSPISLNLLQNIIASQTYEGRLAGAPAVLSRVKKDLSAGKSEGQVNELSAMMDEVIEQTQQAEVEQGEVVTYRVKSRVSLKSDGSSERIKLTEAKLDGSLVNIAVPARMQHVFMEGRFKNGKQPLLPGIVNVFSNGNYVGKQSMGLVPVAKDFQLSLGISNDVTIERARTKDFEDDAGLIRSVRRLTKEYRIHAENMSELEQNLVILEPRPVSRNEKIVAQVTEQSLKSIDEKDPARIDRTPGILEWHVNLASGKSQDVKYTTTVEFSPDIRVTGIEQL